MEFPSGNSTEHRPEIAKHSEEVPMARGKDSHQNSETSQQGKKNACQGHLRRR